MKSRVRKVIYRALAILLALFACLYLLQHVWVHRNGKLGVIYKK